MALTIVTWNIQKGIGVDLRRDLDRTARVLRSFDADVIGLQEVLRTRTSDQAQTLASALDMQLAWGVARATRGGEYGNALLVRGTATAMRVHDLSVARCERRTMLEVVTVSRGVQLRVFVTHLGLGFGERAIQIDSVAACLRAAPPTLPRVIMGDFNEPHAGPVRRVLAREFPNAPKPLRTHPSPLPIFALDRIAWDAPLSGEVRVLGVRGASDHRALMATLS